MSNRALGRRLSSNFKWTFIGEMGSKGLLFLSNVYLARLLSPQGFGLYFLAWTVSMFMWIATDLGISLYGAREVAKDRSNAGKLLNSLISFRFLWALLLYFIFFVAAGYAGIDKSHLAAYRAFGLNILALALFPNWFYKGLEDMKTLAFVNIASMVLYIAMMLAFIRERSDTTLAILLYVSSVLLGSLFLIGIIPQRLKMKVRPVFEPKVWIMHSRELMFFSMTGVLFLISQYAPVVILGLCSTTKSVGIFSAPYRLVLTACTFGCMLPASFYPVLSSSYAKKDGNFEKVYRVLQKAMLLMGLPIGIIGYFLVGDLTPFLWGAKYTGSISIFRILILLVPIIYLRVNMDIGLLASNSQRLNVISSSIGATVTILSGLLLIPAFDAEGAAYSVLIGESTILLLMAYLFNLKVLDKGLPMLFICRIVVSTALPVGIVLIFKSMNIIPKLIIAAALFVASAYLVQTFRDNDLKEVLLG